jgi:hypothetical protein
VPQAAGASAERGLEDATANVDNKRSTLALLHDGHTGSVDAYTIFSKRLPQDRHSYS